MARAANEYEGTDVNGPRRHVITAPDSEAGRRIWLEYALGIMLAGRTPRTSLNDDCRAAALLGFES
jgi:hypothetical protein